MDKKQILEDILREKRDHYFKMVNLYKNFSSIDTGFYIMENGDIEAEIIKAKESKNIYVRFFKIKSKIMEEFDFLREKYTPVIKKKKCQKRRKQ